MKRVCLNHSRRCCPPSHRSSAGPVRQIPPSQSLNAIAHSPAAWSISLLFKKPSSILTAAPSEKPVSLSRLLYFRNKSGAARPLVLCAENRNRNLRGIGVGRNAVLIQVLRRFLHFHVAGERSHDRLLDALRSHFGHHLDHQLRAHPGRRG